MERMFAGYGMEYLWASRFNNFALGLKFLTSEKGTISKDLTLETLQETSIL